MNRARALIEATATAVIWGATFVATKIALQEVSPSTIVWLRFGMGLAVLGVAAGIRGELAPPRIVELPYLALLGLIGVAVHQWLQATGLQTAQATTTAWIVATIPVFIVLLGWLVLHEKPTWTQASGIALASFGVLLVVSKGNPAGLLAGKVATVGDFLVLLSAPNWAIYTVLSRRRLPAMPAAKMIFYVVLVGWIFVTIWAMAFGHGTREISRLTYRGWAAVASLGILGSGVAYVMYYDALRVLPASQLGVFLNIEPLITTFLAAPLLGEPITAFAIVGGASILVGIYLVNRAVPAPGGGAKAGL